MASFQVQAATGRGEWRERAPDVTPEAIAERIRQGVGLPRLAWDTAMVGHPTATGGDARRRRRTRRRRADRPPPLRAIPRRISPRPLRPPRRPGHRAPGPRGGAPTLLAGRGGVFLLRKLWSVRRALWRRERIGKITFFIHNFMDAAHLDPERISNCSFMVRTEDGPVSMCEPTRAATTSS